MRAPGAVTAVACDNVTVRFVTDRRTVTAIENVSFALEAGGFLSLLGPSGCGKSTLLRVIADLVAPTSGAATVLGGSPEQARRGRKLGFVFQDSALLAWRNAIQNVELPLEVVDGDVVRDGRLRQGEVAGQQGDTRIGDRPLDPAAHVHQVVAERTQLGVKDRAHAGTFLWWVADQRRTRA